MFATDSCIGFVQFGLHEVLNMGRCVAFVISGFRCEVAENCALVGYYAASSGNFFPTFWDDLSVACSGFTRRGWC